MILATRFTVIVFLPQNGFDHLVLMTSYLVTIATDHH